MISTMDCTAMWTVLMCVFLMLCDSLCLESEPGAPLRSGVLDLPWKDELCCDSPPAYIGAGGSGRIPPETNRSEVNLPHPLRCTFRSLAAEPEHLKPPVGACLDILCRIDETWENVTCDLESGGGPPIRGQQLLLNNDTVEANSTSHNLLVCDAEDSLMCSFHLDSARSFVLMVTVSISGAAAPPVLLRIPERPEKPGPPVNLSHIQTIEAGVVLSWDEPLDSSTDPLRYQVRYSSSTNQYWQVASAHKEPRLPVDLEPMVSYIFQVRCAGVAEPPLWSDWSESYHIFLDTLSYIPEKVVARAGDNVTVYCVFNDHRINASMARWILNHTQELDGSLYHPVNQWVSQITVRASETGIYDLLKCTKEWSYPYSQIFVEGGFIDIKCVTNGDIDAMDCRWKTEEWTKLQFQYKWADVPCEVMEEKDGAGEDIGETGPACIQVRSFRDQQKSCTIQPLRMNCYKLWLEVSSHQGPVRSKPIYLSPMDYVQPHSPTNVRAVTQVGGVLRVTWKPPYLPAEGLQCQFRYHSLSVIEKWKVQSSVRVPGDEVMVPDMCQVYVVQVRCMHINGTGYWSDWTESVNSTTQNSRTPDRGPDFWRIRDDDHQSNLSNITLLFKSLPVSANSYCVDGFIVQHQTWNGSVLRKQIHLVSSYSFEWNQELQIVTVEAYNNLGSSSNNINMTLEKTPKRHCVRSFHVVVINSTWVSLSWSLSDTSSVPNFMVVHWSPTRLRDTEDLSLRGQTWARLPYSEHSAYLKGDFFSSEEYGFYLYPVFADGEGEPVFTLATRGDPAAYMMLMFISLLCIFVFVTLVLSQNQMKRFVWKDVPNPNKCSWAKGLDFKTVDTFEALFRPSDGLQALPLPAESISRVIIMDKAQTKALVQTPKSLTPDPGTASDNLLTLFDPEVDQSVETEALLGGAPSLTITVEALTASNQSMQLVKPLVEQNPGNTSSAQSSVTYTKVLLADAKQDLQPVRLHYSDSSRCSSSDEGNFSANNSDISESSPSALWELDSCPGAEGDDPRRSCSYNSVEELSESSEQENEGEKKHLDYLEIKYSTDDEESEGEEQREDNLKTKLLKDDAADREDSCVELHHLLGLEDSSQPDKLPSASTCEFSLLYLPQYRTDQHTRRTPTLIEDSQP
ncbi:leptin receptor [Nothobranchius furzeri]